MHLVWVVLFALVAAPKNVVIKKHNGEVIKGTVLSELESGYLIRTAAGKSVKVSFTDIADLSEPGAAAAEPPPGAAPLPPPPPPPPGAPINSNAPPPPPPPPPVAPVAAAPSGPCRAGEQYVPLKADDDISGPLCVDRTEVTVGQYEACVNAGYCRPEELQCDDGANWGRPDRKSHPINCASAIQAEVYCSWKQSRLPTKAEFIAIGKVGDFEYPWGDGYPDGHVCWSGEDRRTGTCPVGTYPNGASKNGVLDLSANVWEWTSSDRRGSRYFMGGAWNEKSHKKVHVDTENKNDPKVHFDDVGFRCVTNSR